MEIKSILSFEVGEGNDANMFIERNDQMVYLHTNIAVHILDYGKPVAVFTSDHELIDSSVIFCDRIVTVCAIDTDGYVYMASAGFSTSRPESSLSDEGEKTKCLFSSDEEESMDTEAPEEEQQGQKLFIKNLI